MSAVSRRYLRAGAALRILNKLFLQEHWRPVGFFPLSYDRFSWSSIVYRGRSKNPLFVTSVGMDLKSAAENVQRMYGEHRIPEIVRLTDRLSRSGP